MKIIRILGIGAALLAVALVIVYLRLVRRGAPVPPSARFALDLPGLRAAAGPEAGLPERAAAEQVGRMTSPELGVIAGGGVRGVTFGFYVWQFVYTSSETVVIDAVHSPAMHAANHLKPEDYEHEAWAHQERAVQAAKVMAATHEHHDHIGGFTESAHYASFGDRLKLTAAQRQDPKMGGIGRTLGGEPTLESGPEGSLHPIAPGVVAISAAGHTPGSQMIYVRLKRGRELLLIGDIVWQNFVLERFGNRPQLVALILGEDGEAIAHQIRAILDLHKANPALDVVVAHDIPAMEARFASGAVHKGLFTPP